MRRTRTTRLSVSADVAVLATALAVAMVPSTGAAGPAPADDSARGLQAGPIKDPVAIGRGGAVSSVDPYASRIGVRVLRRGGTAADLFCSSHNFRDDPPD